MSKSKGCQKTMKSLLLRGSSWGEKIGKYELKPQKNALINDLDQSLRKPVL